MPPPKKVIFNPGSRRSTSAMRMWVPALGGGAWKDAVVACFHLEGGTEVNVSQCQSMSSPTVFYFILEKC